MSKIPNFGVAIRTTREYLFDYGQGRISRPEATVLAGPITLRNAVTVNSEWTDDAIARAARMARSPMKLKDIETKLHGERQI